MCEHSVSFAMKGNINHVKKSPSYAYVQHRPSCLAALYQYIMIGQMLLFHHRDISPQNSERILIVLVLFFFCALTPHWLLRVNKMV